MSAAETTTFLSVGSHGEVAELTGAHTRKDQIATLQRNGIRHWVRRDGWPAVPRSVIDGGPKEDDDSRGWRSNALDAA